MQNQQFGNYNNKIKVLGHNGINGEINCGGAKNLVTKVMVASILTRSETKILNVPNIVDVMSVMNMMREIGINVQYNGKNAIIDSTNLANNIIVKDELGSRISVLFLSVLGHFMQEVTVPMPIGCDLGDRTIDLHLKILTKFGFKIAIENNLCTMRRGPDRIKGCNIELPYPSVGATETAIMLAVLAEGRSVIKGIALEPEIQALILFLLKCGARIKYTEDREILIEGVTSLHSCTFKIMGDRIEAAAWACMACATNGNIIVRNVDPQNLINFFGPFRSIGGGFKIIDDDVISFYRESEALNPIFLETGPYPMFSTDYQPMMATLMIQADGSSIIHETLFTKRLEYLRVLREFGLKYTLDDLCYGQECRFAHKNHVHSAILNGSPNNKFFDVQVDEIEIDTIRSGFAYIIAATVANRTITFHNTQIIKRGFANIVEKLSGIGIKIQDSANDTDNIVNVDLATNVEQDVDVVVG